MADQQLVKYDTCNISPLLHVSDILPFWVQFGREGAIATRKFRGITSCKIAVILYIILCEIRFQVITHEIIVYYNAMLSDMIFNKLLLDRSYAYFFHNTNPAISGVGVFTSKELFREIISNCNILPVGLYNTRTTLMEHYFLIVKFGENDYRIISAYGSKEIHLELTESSIEFAQLLEFVNNVNTGNIGFIRHFIHVYFLNGKTGNEIEQELNSYGEQLQLCYFHNLVGQIKHFKSSYKYQAGGESKKRNHKSSLIHRHRRKSHATRTRTPRRRTTRRRR
jgi:hypothetical protein